MASNALMTLAQMFTTPTPAAPPPMVNGMPAAGPNIPANPANPTAPVQTQVAAPAESKAPLADYKELFTIDPNAKRTAPEPILTIDHEAINKAAASVDFRSSITPELMARMKAGGDDGMAAMMEAMNSMSQVAFAKAAQTAAHVAQEAAKRSQDQLRKEFPNAVKNHTLRSSFQENPALSDPAVAPVVAFITSQIQTKFPKATVAEQREMVSNYFDQLAQSIGTPESKANNQESTLAKSQDFSDW